MRKKTAKWSLVILSALVIYTAPTVYSVWKQNIFLLINLNASENVIKDYFGTTIGGVDGST